MIISRTLAEISVKKSLIDKAYPRPQQEHIQRKLREIYNIFVIVCIDKTLEPKFAYTIDRYIETDEYSEWMKQILSEFLYSDYDEAFENALAEALNLITIKDVRKEKLKIINICCH